MTQRKRLLTGITATGQIHLGNYLAVIRPALEFQSDAECLYFIADLHALTKNKNAEQVRSNTLDVLATWIAAGFDYERHTLWIQSHVPQVTELSWYLSCCIGVGHLEKGHAYKDAIATGKEVNHGLLAYPVLMAADILLYDVDVVPVGKDQKQHIEFCRDMAGSLNSLYGEVLKLPEIHLEEEVMVIPGLDGRKMSKSYDNTIPLFCKREELRKKVMSLKTDSLPLEAPKELRGTLLGILFGCFSTKEEFEDLERRLAQGGMGWGHAKDELFQAIEREVAPLRERYEELRRDEEKLMQIAREGAERARSIALPVLSRVRRAVGLVEAV